MRVPRIQEQDICLIQTHDKMFTVDTSWIPYICVITLRSRPDRIKSFDRWAKDYGFDYDVFFAEKHPRGGYYGCWDSHIQVMHRALDRGSQFALVLEDDCIPNASMKSHKAQKLWDEVKELVAKYESGDFQFDMIGLGGTPLYYTSGMIKHKNMSRHILSIKFSETHAYLISKSFMELMTILPYEGTVDYQMARRSTRMFLVSPELFVQDPKLGSDNESPIGKFLAVRAAGKELLHFVARCWPRKTDGYIVSIVLFGMVLAAVASVIVSRKYKFLVAPVALGAILIAFHFVQYKYMDPYKFYIKPQTERMMPLTSTSQVAPTLSEVA